MNFHRPRSTLLTITLAALATAARAQPSESNPGLPPEVAAELAKYNREYMPSAPFDFAAAQAQLEPGAGTIKGKVVARVRDSKKIQIANLAPKLAATPNVLVTLFPVTAS
jgi:hypothetical protein